MNFFTENIYWLYQQRSLPSLHFLFPFDISFMFRFFFAEKKSNFEKKKLQNKIYGVTISIILKENISATIETIS